MVSLENVQLRKATEAREKCAYSRSCIKSIFLGVLGYYYGNSVSVLMIFVLFMSMLGIVIIF